MDTIIEKIDSLNKNDVTIAKAANILQNGGMVAFPTETVYGLGADGLNAEAARKIYEAKGRPSDNPLIVHIAQMESVAVLAREIPRQAMQLMEAFWPGPLTIILKKQSAVPDGTTGGLDTVAIRMPSHPIALELIRQSGVMIAAPSANTSGRPSPTYAQHVAEDLSGKIDMIIDGGPVGIGIESTIVDMSTGVPTILRPGYITKDMLETVVGTVEIDPGIVGVAENVRPKAPGMKYTHYAPQGELSIVEGESMERVIARINTLVQEKQKTGYRVGVIATEETYHQYHADVVLSIGTRNDELTISSKLYGTLREFDNEKVEYIYSESFSGHKLGNAIMNRMLKAAGHRIITAE